MNLQALMFTRQDQKSLLEQWAMCEEDGLTTMQFCALLTEHGSSSEQKIGREGQQAAADGEAFSQVLGRWCSPMVVGAIDAGEQAGNRLLGIRVALSILQGGQNVMARLAKVTLFPLAMMCATGSMGLYISGEIIQTAQLKMGTGSQLHQTLDTVLPALAIAIALLLTLITIALPLWSGFGRSLADKLPLFSHYRLGVASGFLEVVGKLSETGLSLDESLSLVAPKATPYLRHHIHAMRTTLLRTSNLGSVMDTGLLMKTTQSKLHVLGESQRLTHLLLRAGEHHRDAVEKQLKRLETWLPKVILLIGIGLLLTLVGSVMNDLLTQIL
ncbi:type II secretion system F family protein [Vibrio lentus]